MVLFVYVDNSNVWIEGQRLSAVRRGMAADPVDAMKRGIVDHDWRYDFGRLYAIACPEGVPVGRSILFGSRPPANDSLWVRAQREGFEVRVFDRNAANKEKQVDVSLATTMMEDSYEHMKPARGDRVVLMTGDGDYTPTLESLALRGIPTSIVFWRHATARTLGDVADRFHDLDPHLDFLAGVCGATLPILASGVSTGLGMASLP